MSARENGTLLELESCRQEDKISENPSNDFELAVDTTKLARLATISPPSCVLSKKSAQSSIVRAHCLEISLIVGAYGMSLDLFGRDNGGEGGILRCKNLYY